MMYINVKQFKLVIMYAYLTQNNINIFMHDIM